jgi:PAS domain S-box-containing protein
MRKLNKLEQHLAKIEGQYRQLFDKLSKSEQEKSVILDAMTELVLYLDTNMRVIWANQAMHRAFYLAPGDLDGKHCYRTLHKRKSICKVCPAEKTLATGESYEVEDFSSYGKIWVLRSYPVQDEKGVLTGIVEIVTDVTERRRAEDAMRQSEQKYRELFEYANDIIYFLDCEGNVLSCNVAAVKIWGYTQEEMIGLNISKFFDPDYLPLAQEILKEHYHGIENRKPQIFLTHSRAGDDVWVEANTRIVREKGRQITIQGIARNVTERIKMEEALKRRERELEEKTRNLGEANTALKVLLKHREEDRTELEEKVLQNMNELIVPYVEKLKMTNLESHQLNQLNILEANMHEIISPFLRNLSSKYPKLTPMETQVINFIKEGLTTKEIAKLTNASTRTIEFHRYNIRNKLGLKKMKGNLSYHILSLA